MDFTKLNITDDVLDKLGFSEYRDGVAEYGTRTLHFSDGTRFRITEQDQMDDGNEGWVAPAIYISNHWCFHSEKPNGRGSDLFFLHEMYECIKADFPDCLNDFVEKCRAVNMGPYIDYYLSATIVQ